MAVGLDARIMRQRDSLEIGVEMHIASKGNGTGAPEAIFASNSIWASKHGS
jgi:hypothetical protein